MKILLLCAALLLSTSSAWAESNVEDELCYMDIHRAIKVGSKTGRFELHDTNCVKYKANYDRKYGDPMRLKLLGEPQASTSLQTNKGVSTLRNECWDALIHSKYDRKTYFENTACVAFLEVLKSNECVNMFTQIYIVDLPILEASPERMKACRFYIANFKR